MTIAAPPPTAEAHPMPDDAGIAMSSLPSATYVSNALSTTVPASTTATVPAPLVIVQGGIPIYEQERIGSTCCGCCCDFRRAVLIVDAITIGLSLYTLSNSINPPDNTNTIYYEGNSTIDDDQVQKEIDQIFQDGNLAYAVVAGIVMVFTLVPLYGALKFKIKWIAFGIVLQVASFITEFTFAYFLNQRIDDISDKTDYEQPWITYTIQAIVTSLFIYPHVGLIMEIQQGIMTPETYVREDYCCCHNRRSRQTPTATQVQAYSNTTSATMNGQLPAVPAYR